MSCPGFTVDKSETTVPDSDVDAIVTVECLENHVLKGEAALTCRSDGTWSSEVPTCEEVGKITPPH